MACRLLPEPEISTTRAGASVSVFGEAIAQCELFVAIGTSGQVIDIVTIAREFEHSLLINPKREEYVTAFGSFEQNIDTFFERFIQKKAVEAADEMSDIITRFLQH